MAEVVLYDTTLRDGAQMEGISLSVQDKLRIAERLDQLGVHFIEGGWPGSNPKDEEFFEQAKDAEAGELPAHRVRQHAPRQRRRRRRREHQGAAR